MFNAYCLLKKTIFKQYHINKVFKIQTSEILTSEILTSEIRTTVKSVVNRHGNRYNKKPSLFGRGLFALLNFLTAGNVAKRKIVLFNLNADTVIDNLVDVHSWLFYGFLHPFQPYGFRCVAMSGVQW